MNHKKIITFLILLPISILASNRLCSYCISEIDTNFIKYDDNIYHYNCFDTNIRPKCNKCNMNIKSNYKIFNDNLFHPMCYKNIKFPMCDLCHKQIKNNYSQDLWGNKFHQEHLLDSQKCYYCSRIISEGITNGGYKIEDGRSICALCESKTIFSIKEIESSRKYVLNKLSEFGFNNLPEDVKIIMVDQEKLSLYSGKFLPGTIFIPDIKGYTKHLNDEFVIYIINHTPKIEFEAILAHEYLHVWQIKNNIIVNNDLNEGISSLGNFIVYNEYNNEYSKVKLNQMNSDNYIYRKGYVEIKQSIDDYGWQQTIQNLISK